MNHQVISGFHVVGFSVRTCNALESTGKGKIPGVWAKFMQSDAGGLLPGKLGDEIYAVYTDYASNQDGDYTCVVGYKVTSRENLPKGLTAVEIPSGNYVIVTSDQGLVTQIVPGVWRRIWALTPDELNGTRSFRADFELYDQRSMNPSAAQVDVYIGLC